MTRYEQELRKLFDDSGLMERPQYSGRVCVGELGKDLRVRAEFFSAHVADQYDVIRLTVLNRKEGVVDRTLLRFKDVWGKKPVPSNPNFRSGVMPHLWDDRGDVDWYVYHPSAADYDLLRRTIGQYLSMFRERTPERAQDRPKLVFICAPLRGDIEKNIEFARQKAQEVFTDGDIPICPHLLFPPIADPNHPEQEAKAREMSLRLLESCQQLNVYGPIWTEGMWAEIHRAGKMGIPIMTDQKTIGRTPPRRSGRKERYRWNRNTRSRPVLSSGRTATFLTPPVGQRQEVASKKGSRSGPDSPATAPSSTSSKDEDRTTSEERPSVLERLKGYKAQLEQQRSASARTKDRQKSKSGKVK